LDSGLVDVRAYGVFVQRPYKKKDGVPHFGARVASEADVHGFVAALGLCLGGSEKVIPEGEHFSVVATIFLVLIGVVDAVGLRGDEEGS